MQMSQSKGLLLLPCVEGYGFRVQDNKEKKNEVFLSPPHSKKIDVGEPRKVELRRGPGMGER